MGTLVIKTNTVVGGDLNLSHYVFTKRISGTTKLFIKNFGNKDVEILSYNDTVTASDGTLTLVDDYAEGNDHVYKYSLSGVGADADTTLTFGSNVTKVLVGSNDATVYCYCKGLSNSPNAFGINTANFKMHVPRVSRISQYLQLGYSGTYGKLSDIAEVLPYFDEGLVASMNTKGILSGDLSDLYDHMNLNTQDWGTIALQDIGTVPNYLLQFRYWNMTGEVRDLGEYIYSQGIYGVALTIAAQSTQITYDGTVVNAIKRYYITEQGDVTEATPV